MTARLHWTWHTHRVRHSDFATLVREEFGDGHAATLLRSHVLNALGGRTAEAALADGIQPRVVWSAICDDFDVPVERRFGRDRPRRR